ncbi:putative transporter [Limnohabitans lacus]|jgi:peptide/bleomycin uptake transporter|uniref:Transporter n=1 Tax=Limnohabitans lacus TaxID=3045173 RepID=A0ABT6X7E2_9BURK|nr:putative transporter [Limnohabitans sp. HM2-2]MDI9234043.1 putative transporter [Limnohabitans sp. HM2-2]
MFRAFFGSKRWWVWAWLGSALILMGTWYKVQLSVQINDWFGAFYDSVQQALSQPGSISEARYLGLLLSFFQIAGIFVLVAVLQEFFSKHFVFRWRTAMNDFYIAHWDRLRQIEGASQRVQEDTMRFARLMETLGLGLMDSMLTLLAFLPILWTLSEKVTALPWIGPVSHSLVYVALLFAIFGTVLLAGVGGKLPGLEYANQRVEAAYRKELVIGEDDPTRAAPPTLKDLFRAVRTNHFRMYFHYMYFDAAKWSYLQAGVLVPYIALAPSIVAGAFTLGVMEQIARAFSQVQESFQYLVRSWSSIVELVSVFKRLRAFEKTLKES